jgi:UDP-3-O-[3-hydroxymyristoyl] glucosamine N-acyltransferase
MKLSDLAEQLENSTLEGEDCEVEGIALAGEGKKDEIELWFDSPVSGADKVVVEAGVRAPEAESVLTVKDLNEQLPVLLKAVEGGFDNWGIEDNVYLSEDFSYEQPVYIGAGSWIGPDVQLDREVRIDPGVTIKGKVRIGKNVHLHSGVRIESQASIGSGTIIHANTVIGADGYGYRQKDGRHLKVPQVGGVVIGKNVEIGALSTVDRGTITDTEIGEGSKIDNQVHVAHNCKIGRHCLMAGKSALSGSVTLGDYVIIGAEGAVTEHVSVTDKVTIAGRSGVTKDITEEGITVSGFPARPHREELRAQVIQRHLPKLREKINKIENQMEKFVEEREER